MCNTILFSCLISASEDVSGSWSQLVGETGRFLLPRQTEISEPVAEEVNAASHLAGAGGARVSCYVDGGGKSGRNHHGGGGIGQLPDPP